MNKEKKLNILFIQIAEYSFDESFLLFRVMDQLPPTTQAYCLLNSVSAGFISSQPEFLISLITENLENNYHDFQVFLRNVELDAIFILDLPKYFVQPGDINFRPEWLVDVDIPVFALDYFNLLTVNDAGQVELKEVSLKGDSFMYEVPPLPINPVVIKPSPPIQERKEIPRVEYWNTIFSQHQFIQNERRQEIVKTTKISEDTIIIGVIFDPLLFQRALEANMLSFFFIAIEVIIYYLRHFEDKKFLLMVSGMPPQPDTNPIENLNVTVKFFSSLTYDLYQTMICGCDLFFSNSCQLFMQADAMALYKPTIVLGNSITYELKGDNRELASYFNPSPVLYHLIKILEELNQWSFLLPIYPFINFPIRELDIPEPGIQKHVYPFHLIDMFDDLTTGPILEKLLFDEKYKEGFASYCYDMSALAEKERFILNILDSYLENDCE